MRDFVCQRCRVESTASPDHICGLCRAIGKTAVPEDEGVSWRDFICATELTREAFFSFQELTFKRTRR